MLGEFGNDIHPTLRRHDRPGAQPDRGPQPGDRQHDDLGARLQPVVLHRPAVRRLRGRELDAEVLRGAVVEPLHGQRRGHGLGESPVQRGPIRQRTRAAASSARPSGGSSTSRPMRGPRPCRRRISTRSSRSTTSGIATTTTATATSTSPMATSTISSRSTRASARRPAAAHRAPTRSGVTAGTRTTRDPRSGLMVLGRTGSRACGSGIRTTGSATTRSSRRTAVSACSRTSSPTTSAFRTSTTRRATRAAPRTARASGR